VGGLPVEEPARKIFTRSMFAWTFAVGIWLCVGLGLSTAIIATNGAYSRFGSYADTLHKLEAARGDWDFPYPGEEIKPIAGAIAASQSSTVLTTVFGDSHAEQWFARVNNLTDRPAQVQFITRGGCLPIPGYGRFDDKGHCGDFAAEGWSKVLELQPHRLVISAAWLMYVGDAKSQSTATSCIQVENQCQLINSSADLYSLFLPLKVKVQQAIKQGISVTILGPIPFSEQSYVDEKVRELTSQHLPLRLRRPTTILTQYLALLTKIRFAAVQNPSPTN
jgi:hypothetical protein